MRSPRAITANFRRGRGNGFAGNSILAVATVAVFLSGPGQTYGVSVFIDPIIDETGWSRSLIASIYSLATLLSAGGILIVGRYIDRLGNRRILAVATVFFAAGLILASLAIHPLMLMVAFALMRTFGSASLPLAARTLIPHWFLSRRGRAFGIVGVGASLSLALFPPFGEALIGLFGWRTAWRIEAVLLVLILIPLILRRTHNRPEDIGQYADGMSRESSQLPASAGMYENDISWTLRQAMSTRSFWLLICAGLVPSLVVTGLAFNQISILTSNGLPASLAATTFAVESLIALPTTLMSGWLSDRFAARYVLAASQFCLAGAMIFLLFADSILIALVYAAVRGASSGLWNVAADVLWPKYFGRAHLGSIRSATFAATVLGAAIGPLPLGIAYDYFGTYSGAIAAMLILPVFGFFAVLHAKPPVAPFGAAA
ncbi:MFS transporter [soil metagenome]